MATTTNQGTTKTAPVTELNNNSVRRAVLEWKRDAVAANEKYGPIGEWNVAAVTDFSEREFMHAAWVLCGVRKARRVRGGGGRPIYTDCGGGHAVHGVVREGHV